MQFQNAMIYTEKFRFEHGAFAVENGRFARRTDPRQIGNMVQPKIRIVPMVSTG